MKTYTEEEIIEKYKELPPDVRDAIFGVDSTRTIEEIGKKYKLTIDKLGDLSNEIRVLMLGITEPKDFISNISRRLGVDKKMAHDITAEVNEKIFSKIRESLKRIHNIKDEEENEEKEVELPKSEAVKAPEPPKELSREDILKEIEYPESIPMPTIFSGNTKSSESSVQAQPAVQKSFDVKEEELSLPPPPPALIENKEESVVVVKEVIPKEEVKSGDASTPPKPQISRRPPEVSEHDGDKSFGPGGDRYPEGDPYREPVR